MSYKYTDLIKLGTQYAGRMNYLSNRIFGEVARTTNEKSMKVGKTVDPYYNKTTSTKLLRYLGCSHVCRGADTET